jgi:hypothetical protein
MSTFRNPVGPQPSNVYWRRRLVLGLGILAVIVIIVLIIVKPGSGGTPTPEKTNPSGASSQTPDEPAGDPKACKESAIKVTAVSDKNGYQAGEKPAISLTIENTGAAACTFSVGPDVQKYVIKTGDETVWSSDDCAAESEPVTMTLESEDPLSTTQIVWDRTKSSSETCEGDRPAVTAGGASYHLSVSVNGVEASESKQFLLY